MNALNEVLLGAAAVLSPIWISCLLGIVCWIVKRTISWIRNRREARR